MKRLLISGCVVVALLAVATTLRSHSPSNLPALTTANNAPAMAGVSTLLVEEFEDMSLVFSKPAKH